MIKNLKFRGEIYTNDTEGYVMISPNHYENIFNQGNILSVTHYVYFIRTDYCAIIDNEGQIIEVISENPFDDYATKTIKELAKSGFYDVIHFEKYSPENGGYYLAYLTFDPLSDHVTYSEPKYMFGRK